MNELRPLSEIADETGISRRTVERWIQKGGLIGHRFAGDKRVFIDPNEVRRLERHSMARGLQMQLTACTPGQFERLGPDIVPELYREWPSCRATWTESIFGQKFETCIHWRLPFPEGFTRLGAARDAERRFLEVLNRVPGYATLGRPTFRVGAHIRG